MLVLTVWFRIFKVTFMDVFFIIKRSIGFCHVDAAVGDKRLIKKLKGGVAEC
jgi:hypothetical protein